MSNLTEKNEQILFALKSGEHVQAKTLFMELHNYEQVQLFKSLSKEDRLVVYGVLSPKETSDFFDFMDEDAAEYLGEMHPQYAADVLSEMFADNGAKLLNHVDKEDVAKYLTLMPAENSKELKALLKYDVKTAGSLMTTEFVTISENETVGNGVDLVKASSPDAETVYYIYVVDGTNKIKGVISLRDLLVNDDNLSIADIMSSRVITAKVGDEQMLVAKTISDYDLLAVPVVNYDNQLVGIVTVDDVVDIIVDEAITNYSGLAAVDVAEVSENPLKAASKRLPWLITLLFLGMATATLIGHYEDLVSEASVLAVFISLITGTSGNAGTQSLAVAVRRLAMDDGKSKKFLSLIFSEIMTGLISGLVTGITIMLVVGIWKQNFMLGFVIGVAMLFAIAVGNLAGSLIPMVMDKLGFDPAVASGPFITTLSDLTSVLIYFNIASLFMDYFI